MPPSALRDAQLEMPTVRWEDIGGQAETIAALREAVEWPLRHAAAFARLGVRAPRGVLLYGPPGTGKTLMARQIGRMLRSREPKIVNGTVTAALARPAVRRGDVPA